MFILGAKRFIFEDHETDQFFNIPLLDLRAGVQTQKDCIPVWDSRYPKAYTDLCLALSQVEENLEIDEGIVVGYLNDRTHSVVNNNHVFTPRTAFLSVYGRVSDRSMIDIKTKYVDTGKTYRRLINSTLGTITALDLKLKDLKSLPTHLDFDKEPRLITIDRDKATQEYARA